MINKTIAGCYVAACSGTLSAAQSGAVRVHVARGWGKEEEEEGEGGRWRSSRVKTKQTKKKKQRRFRCFFWQRWSLVTPQSCSVSTCEPAAEDSVRSSARPSVPNQNNNQSDTLKLPHAAKRSNLEPFHGSSPASSAN